LRWGENGTDVSIDGVEEGLWNYLDIHFTSYAGRCGVNKRNGRVK